MKAGLTNSCFEVTKFIAESNFQIPQEGMRFYFHKHRFISDLVSESEIPEVKLINLYSSLESQELLYFQAQGG
jgi:hypothetical protein